MLLPIIKYGSSLLRKKAFDIDLGDSFTEIGSNMMNTLKNAEGIGLAGPQVAVLKNIFIIDTTPIQNDEIEPIEKIYINPEIINYDSDNAYYNEGCLSIPGINEDVIRPSQIEVRYRDENFDIQEEILEGITARIYQHEYDHLQGMLFIDRLSAIRRKMIAKKIKQIIIKQ